MSQDASFPGDASVGRTLAAAREDMNLSVSDVARHLKISPAQVEALEKGAYERLPGRVFVRGFLRNYAKLLGLEPEPLLRSIEAQMPAPAVAREQPASPKVVMPRDQQSRWPLKAAVVGMVIVGALAVYEFGFNDAPPTEDRNPETNTAVPPPVPADAAAPPPQGDAATGAPLAEPLAAEPIARGQTELVAVRDAVAEPKRAAATVRELHFHFDEESWVEVRDADGGILLSKLNAPGSEVRVNGKPPLKVVIGNARGVRLTYADRTVDLEPHTGLAVARFTLQ
jgi:cytoskeleton protein RodZ